MKHMLLITLLTFSFSALSQKFDFYFEHSDYIENIKESEKGEAYLVIGLTYYYGNDDIQIEKDINRAVYWLEKAATKNMPMAQSMIALSYTIGFGLPKDENKGFNWDFKAAKNGVTQSQSRVALAYKIGIGTIQNYKRAYAWYAVLALSANDIDRKSMAIEQRDNLINRLSQESFIQAQDMATKLYSEIYNDK